jgi:YD repeat-containing protein
MNYNDSEKLAESHVMEMSLGELADWRVFGCEVWYDDDRNLFTVRNAEGDVFRVAWDDTRTLEDVTAVLNRVAKTAHDHL